MIELETGNFFGDMTKFLHGDHITACITDYQLNDYSADEQHFHHHPNLFFIVQGSVHEKWSRGCATKMAGSLSYYPAGAPHQNERKTFPARSLNIELEHDFLKLYDLNEELLEITVVGNPLSKFLMLQIYRELIENDELSTTSIKMQVLDLVARSERLVHFKGWPEWLKTLKSVLHERWNENPSLQELSEATGVHPITISKYFSRYFRCTLGQYLRTLKVERALSLIKENTTLTDVAFQCGFADQSHFIRNFKHLTNLLPSEYQRIFVQGKPRSI
jgi:AraC family transcriptional regulator